MIKQILLSTFLLVVFSMSNLANAQNKTEIDQRLLSKFSKKELSKMNVDELNFWNFYVQDGFVVFDIKKEKSESEIEFLDYNGEVTEINPLALGLLPEEAAVKTYQLGNTGKGIMILSEKKIKAKMNRMSK